MKIGFIGLGRMGMPMATNLLKKGFELHVFNRTRSKVESLAFPGLKIADSPADLARRVDIVLASLANVSASHEVFLGKNGVVSAARPGQILVDHSTVDPETSRKVYNAAEQIGAHFLDAPVSGGPEGAEAASLSIMVGGGQSAFQKALPVFRSMGKTIAHMGGCGSGTVTKLATQILVGVHTLASCEAMLLGIKSGVDPEKLARVLGTTWGSSKMLERNASFITRREFGPSAVPIRNLAKDLGIIVELGEQMGLSFPSAKLAESINRSAADDGGVLNDITAIYQLLDHR